MKRTILLGLVNLLIILTLAILSQVGALTYVATLLLCRLAKIKSIGLLAAVNFIVYGLVCWYVLPAIAPYFGRVPITTNTNLKLANPYLSVGLNRHYVTPELDRLLTRVSSNMSKIDTNLVVLVLDANFPFIDGYPLAPHLSHNNGNKVDLAYIYVDVAGELLNRSVSYSGYGHFENPKAGERDTNQFCQESGYFQYDYPKYLTFGKREGEFVFSESWNKKLLQTLLTEKVITKVFVEQHLVDRLGLADDRLRFQGCGSVRHDDHIHLQITAVP